MMATDLGMVGVWSGRLQSWTSTEATALVEEWQDLGYGTLWVPESPMAKDVLTFAAVLLSVSRSLVIATGIAVIWKLFRHRIADLLSPRRLRRRLFRSPSAEVEATDTASSQIDES